MTCERLPWPEEWLARRTGTNRDHLAGRYVGMPAEQVERINTQIVFFIDERDLFEVCYGLNLVRFDLIFLQIIFIGRYKLGRGMEKSEGPGFSPVLPFFLANFR